MEKSKAPRMSMASSKAPEGSFLERMMRPTQSSSQKTHEKIEARSPPAKPQAKKHTRISQGSDRSKGEHEETKAEAAREESKPPQEEDSAVPSQGTTTDADKTDDKVNAPVAAEPTNTEAIAAH